MLYEFAIDPMLPSTWTDLSTCAYIYHSFGLGRARIMTAIPDRWANKAIDHITTTDDILRKYVEEVVFYLDRESCSPRQSWNQDWNFSTNVGFTHDLQPFHAIMSTRRDSFHPRCHSKVISVEDIVRRHSLWDVEISRSVNRTAQNITRALLGILQMGSEILFVDPYFSPKNGRYDTIMRSIFAAIADRDRDVPDRIELVCSRQKLTTGWTDAECSQWLQRNVPDGLSVRVVSVDDGIESRRLHDRFVLCDLGGVQFSNSFSEARGGSPKVMISGLDIHGYSAAWVEFREVGRSFRSAHTIFI